MHVLLLKYTCGLVAARCDLFCPVRCLMSCSADSVYITKKSLYKFDPLKPHFYIVKLVNSGTCIHCFLISAKKTLKNIDCGYSLESPWRGGSNVYPQSMFWAEIWKISEFLSENFRFFFLVIKFSVYLNRHVFVMIIVTTSLGKRKLVAYISLVCGLCSVCHALSSLPLYWYMYATVCDYVYPWTSSMLYLEAVDLSAKMFFSSLSNTITSATDPRAQGPVVQS